MVSLSRGQSPEDSARHTLPRCFSRQVAKCGLAAPIPVRPSKDQPPQARSDRERRQGPKQTSPERHLPRIERQEPLRQQDKTKRDVPSQPALQTPRTMRALGGVDIAGGRRSIPPRSASASVDPITSVDEPRRRDPGGGGESGDARQQHRYFPRGTGARNGEAARRTGAAPGTSPHRAYQLDDAVRAHIAKPDPTSPFYHVYHD